MLAALAHGPVHGYGVITRMRQDSGGVFAMPEGTIYPALHRLEAAGLVSSIDEFARGKRRRVYALDGRGRRTAGGAPCGMDGVQHGGLAHDRGAAGVKVTADDPIDAYLDRLFVALSGTPRQIRRSLAEAELHLHESAEELEATGLSSEQARAEAVRRMGPAEVAAGPVRVTLYLSPALRRRVALSVLLIGGVGGVAIGLASAFGLIVRELWGPAAIANAFPADSYTAADCEHWQAANPTAHDCLSVMTTLHASHFLLDTLVCGVLGVLALVLHGRLRRRWSLPGRLGELFELELLVGAAAAGTVALIFLVRGIHTALVTHDNGVGQPFCLAAAAALAALFFALRARRRGVSAQLGSRRPPPALA